MKKVFLLLISLWISTVTVYGQGGKLPPVNLPAGKHICDDSSWQLVFRDHFDGITLNPAWLTFNSWAGMPGGDHEHWAEARCVYPYNAIYKDENIEVNNGTVKLYLKKEPATWQCRGCSTARQANYTNATIALPYTKAFNAGRFEARIKMPVFKWAHSTFWTYMGNTVNEIDIAESYGVSGVPAWPVFKYAPTCNYSLHAWDPPAQENPHQLRHDDVTNRYPGQHWYDWLGGKYFKQADFHIYTCEWDSTVVRFYLDGKMVNELWKYYQERRQNKRAGYNYKAGAGCSLGPGIWRILPGFPYNNQSSSNLRLTIAVDQEDDQHPDGMLGAMEIDYVKIWQRHPEGSWIGLDDSVRGEAQGLFQPEQPTAGQSKDDVTVFCSETHHTADGTAHYNFYADLPSTGAAVYEWDIDYGPGLSLQLNTSGPFVSTPSFAVIPGHVNTVKWKVTVNSNKGTLTRAGQMNYNNRTPVPDSSADQEPGAIYVVAAIPDDTVYKQAVQQRLFGTTVDAQAAEVVIDQLVYQLEMQELAPYIIYDRVLNGKTEHSSTHPGKPVGLPIYSGRPSGNK